jgi:hypothetical protein
MRYRTEFMTTNDRDRPDLDRVFWEGVAQAEEDRQTGVMPPLTPEMARKAARILRPENWQAAGSR